MTFESLCACLRWAWVAGWNSCTWLSPFTSSLTLLLKLFCPYHWAAARVVTSNPWIGQHHGRGRSGWAGSYMAALLLSLFFPPPLQLVDLVQLLATLQLQQEQTKAVAVCWAATSFSLLTANTSRQPQCFYFLQRPSGVAFFSCFFLLSAWIQYVFGSISQLSQPPT